MSTDYTQAQGGEEWQRSVQLSQQRGRPPCEVPGYEPRRFLGSGAYGEVWVAIDRTTGRQVAIKFYLHRGGLDWSLLSHEVEKLAFLSADRYVVQLLDVGWDAEPPFYVMEYVENGSLEERLQQAGRLPAAEATSLFREIAVGLMHSHGKGVLHCDLKPANILLDQDGKPRLADFGQSRLSHEQTPALGTLFYMAPEQADPKAVPDARWDVYALGAIFYAMLTGHPPHRHEKAVTEIESAPHLDGRLARYRQLITQAPAAAEHRQIRGVDKRLALIIDHCLAADPAQRFPTVQAVHDALDARQRRRSRRPLVVLGALGPLLLLSVMSALAWLWFNTSLGHSSDALTQSALKGLGFAAQSVAIGASAELETRLYDVEEAAIDPQLIQLLSTLESEPQQQAVLVGLNDPEVVKEKGNDLIDQLRKFPQLKSLEARLAHFDSLMLAKNIKSASWFITDSRGVQLARWFASDVTLGRSFAWRSYFHGGVTDQPIDWRPPAGQHVQKPHLSAAYRSKSSDVWVVAISAPVYQALADGQKQFLGVVGVSFKVGKQFIELPKESRQFAVLVDARQGERSGLILQHPLYANLVKESDELPERFEKDEQYRVATAVLSGLENGLSDYADPIGYDEQGAEYRKRYLAAQAPIEVRDAATRSDVPTGWVIVVQDPYNLAIGGTLDQLRGSLVGSGLVALAVFGLVIVGMWWFVVRMLEQPVRWQPAQAATHSSIAETLPQGRQQKT